jgi:hypothetical protein
MRLERGEKLRRSSELLMQAGVTTAQIGAALEAGILLLE